MKIQSTVRHILPEEAARLLERSRTFVKVEDQDIEALARDMQNGEWFLNGAPIVIGSSGELLDGRVRSMACVRAKAGFTTLVVEGIDPSTFETMDALRKRRLGDVLAIKREHNGRALAAALRIIWVYEHGGPFSGNRPPSASALLSLLEERPNIRESVAPGLAASPTLPHGCGIAIHHLASAADEAAATRFLTLLGQPSLTDESSPVSVLRDVLLGLRGQGGARNQSYMLAVTIKAFNGFRLGREVKLLRFARDREEFPRIEGQLKPASPTPKAEAQTTMDFGPTSSKVRARLTDITPQLATRLLANNNSNRNVSAPVVAKYARDMASGKWVLNGQTIKVGVSGQLLDGQHRLLASQRSGVAFKAILVEGLDDSVLRSLDIGRRRSVAEVLRERGEASTLVLAAALRWLWMRENNAVLAANMSPTHSELLDILSKNPGLRSSVRYVLNIGRIMGPGLAASLHYEFSVIDQSDADIFFDRLMDGVELSANNPIYKLRERLLETKTSHRRRIAEAERMALALKAWNGFRSGKPMQLLIWRNRGEGREHLPDPK